MLTVIRRPQGHSIGTTAVVATVAEAYGAGDVSFIKVGHGLSDGDFIYVTSNIGDYNGFWYVDVITGDNFKLKASENSDFLQWVANGTITYYESDLTHGWSCVHLPIVYQLESNLWPVNSSDTARTVSSFTDANGYVNLNLSGALKGTVQDLDYVKISGAADDDLNGVFQITDAVSTSDITINLAYDSGYSFAGATVQYYYNNYHVRVKVFGGLAEDHAWEFQKPFVELAELKLTPDSNNQIIFSVHEILKSQINTRNNLLLNTLPLNLDFFTSFYISYAESYDTSDGSEVTTTVSSYTSDQYTEGWTNVTIDALSSWLENGTGEDWSNTSTPTVTLADDQDSENKYVDVVMTAGMDYRILYSFSVNVISSSSPLYSASIRIRIKDSSDSVLLTKTISPFNPANLDGIYTFVAPTGASRISVSVTQETTSGTITNEYIINSIELEIDQASGFSGYAANSKLEFKNAYSGWMTEYINGKWLTLFTSPTIFDGLFFDLSAIIDQSGTVDVIVNGDVSDSFEADPGIYRIPITATGYDMTIKLQMDGADITDSITLQAYNNCEHENIYLTWLNNLGGFDYWNFTAKKDYQVEIQESGVTRQNIFPTWPQSYGTFADTIRKQTYRVSNKFITVRSQHVTQAQLDAISYIKSSVLVQIVTSRQDRRTVIVDADSFMKYRDRDDTYSIAFNIYFTDDIPSQTV
jgi:hypothetical protein